MKVSLKEFARKIEKQKAHSNPLIQMKLLQQFNGCVTIILEKVWSHAHNHSFSYLTNIDKAHLQRYVSVVDANTFITESIVMILLRVSWEF